MIYEVTNGELSVGAVKIANITSSSTLFIGDTKTVALSMIFETPPEDIIVGVTVGRIPERFQRERGE